MGKIRHVSWSLGIGGVVVFLDEFVRRTKKAQRVLFFWSLGGAPATLEKEMTKLVTLYYCTIAWLDLSWDPWDLREHRVGGTTVPLH